MGICISACARLSSKASGGVPSSQAAVMQNDLARTAPQDRPLPSAELHLLGDGNRLVVHDPTVTYQNRRYYLFNTGKDNFSTKQIPTWTTESLSSGKWAFYDFVLPEMPRWLPWFNHGTQQIDPADTQFLWAPHINFFNGRFHLYYAASRRFGQNESCIGVATNQTLDKGSPQYGWQDQGLVIASNAASNFNTIDPNIVFDEGGTPWLSWGSFSWPGANGRLTGYGGLWTQPVDPSTGKLDHRAPPHQIAERPPSCGCAIEGPCIVRHSNGYYYLFMSFDFCSNAPGKPPYRIAVGRARAVPGPYTDRRGTSLLSGGGSPVLFYDETGGLVSDKVGCVVEDRRTGHKWVGCGAVSVLQGVGSDKIFMHSYLNAGESLLRVFDLEWDAEGWPFIRWRNQQAAVPEGHTEL